MEQLAEKLRLRLADRAAVVFPVGDPGRRNASQSFAEFTLGPAMCITQTGKPGAGSLGCLPSLPFRGFERIDPFVFFGWPHIPESEGLVEAFKDDGWGIGAE